MFLYSMGHVGKQNPQNKMFTFSLPLHWRSVFYKLANKEFTLLFYKHMEKTYTNHFMPFDV